MNKDYSDTYPQAEKVMIQSLRKMSPEARFEIALELIETSRKLLEAGVRARHPEYNEREIKLAVIRAILGDKLFKKVYPDSIHIKP